MFYCNPCADGHGWPKTIFVSHGACEICYQVGACNDTPSKYLTPTDEQQAIESIKDTIEKRRA